MQKWLIGSLLWLAVHLNQAQAQDKSLFGVSDATRELNKVIDEGDQGQINPVLYKRIQNLIILDDSNQPDEEANDVPSKPDTGIVEKKEDLIQANLDLILDESHTLDGKVKGSEDAMEKVAMARKTPPSRYDIIAKKEEVPLLRYAGELTDAQRRNHALWKKVQKLTEIEKKTPPSRYGKVLKNVMSQRTPPSRYDGPSATNGDVVENRGVSKGMAELEKKTPPSRYERPSASNGDEVENHGSIPGVREGMAQLRKRTPPSRYDGPSATNEVENRFVSEGMVEFKKKTPPSRYSPEYAGDHAGRATETDQRHGGVRELVDKQQKTPPSRYPSVSNIKADTRHHQEPTRYSGISKLDLHPGIAIADVSSRKRERLNEEAELHKRVPPSRYGVYGDQIQSDIAIADVSSRKRET